MKTKGISLIIVILLGSAVLVARLRNQYEIPERWDSVHIGMTRSQVYAIVAKPDADWADIKGCFWFRNTVTGWQELHASFDKDERVSDVSVIRFLGTRNHFMKQTLRYEYDLMPTEIKHHDSRM